MCTLQYICALRTIFNIKMCVHFFSAEERQASTCNTVKIDIPKIAATPKSVNFSSKKKVNKM